MTPIGSSLWITLIGMGLVFIAILLLWGLMEAVVRLTNRFPGKTEEEGEDEAEVEAAEAAPAAEAPTGLKARAAAAAVAFALAKRSRSSFQPTASSPSGSAWQAVTRSFQLNSRGQMTARKTRGK